MTIQQLVVVVGLLAAALCYPKIGTASCIDDEKICTGGTLKFSAPIAEFQATLAACTQVLETAGCKPQHRELVLARRGMVYLRLERFDRSKEDFEAAIVVAKKPETSSHIKTLLSRWYAYHGDFDQAIIILDEAFKETPHVLDILQVRAEFHVEIGNIDKALVDLNYYIRFASEPDLGAFSLRGSIFHRQEKYLSAIRDFDKVLVRAKGKKAARFALADRGRAFEKMGNLKAALRDYREAYAQGLRNPKFVDYLRKLETRQ